MKLILAYKWRIALVASLAYYGLASLCEGGTCSYINMLSHVTLFALFAVLGWNSGQEESK